MRKYLIAVGVGILFTTGFAGAAHAAPKTTFKEYKDPKWDPNINPNRNPMSNPKLNPYSNPNLNPYINPNYSNPKPRK